MALNEALQKHNITLGDAFHNMKSNSKMKRRTKTNTGETYIRKTSMGTFTVINRKYYGSYVTIEDARQVKEFLINNNWDAHNLEDFLKLKRIPRNSRGRRRESRFNNEDHHIHKSYGKFNIRKTRNYETTGYGTYDDIRVARRIRDRLILCNWDKSQLKSIVDDVLGG